MGGALEVELAYALMSEYWGQGLATEMSRSIVTLGFEQLGLAEHRRLHADDEPGVTARHGKDRIHV